jgi:hypothetical protein
MGELLNEIKELEKLLIKIFKMSNFGDSKILLEATGACSAKMRGATLRICGLANLLRIA